MTRVDSGWVVPVDDSGLSITVAAGFRVDERFAGVSDSRPVRAAWAPPPTSRRQGVVLVVSGTRRVRSYA